MHCKILAQMFNKTITNFSIYTLLTFFQKGIGFIMLPIYTTLLSPAEFGTYNQVIAIGSIFILIFTFALDEAAATFYHKSKNNHVEKAKVLSSILISVNFICVLGFLFLWFNKNFIYQTIITDSNSLIMILSILIICTSPIFIIYQKILRIKEKAYEFAFIMFLNIIMQVLSAIILIIYFDLGSIGLIASFTMTSVLFYTYSFIQIYRDCKSKFDLRLIIKLFKYSIPIIPHKVSGWAMTGFTIVSIGYFIDDAAVGIFIAVGFLGIIIDVLSKSFFNAYQPWVYSKIEEGALGQKAILKNAKIFGLVAVLLSIPMIFLSEELIYFFIDKRYHYNIIIAPIMIFSSVCLFMGSLFTFILYYNEKATKYVTKATTYGALINIICSIILTQKFGIIGAITSLAFANLFIGVSKFLYAIKYLKKDYSFLSNFFYIFVIMLLGIISIHYNFSTFLKLGFALITTIILIFISNKRLSELKIIFKK